MSEASIAKDQQHYSQANQPVLERASTIRPESRRTAGTGNPRAPLEERSRDELYNLAEEHDIKGRSRMNKRQLITAIRRRTGTDL